MGCDLRLFNSREGGKKVTFEYLWLCVAALLILVLASLVAELAKVLFSKITSLVPRSKRYIYFFYSVLLN